jgi:hypothetical protein
LLESDDATLDSNAVFGSMWLSNFVAYFEYDFSGIDNTEQITLFISPDYALNGTRISKNHPVVGTTSFTWLDLPVIFPVEVNSTTLVAAINAELGFQGVA